MTGSLVVVVAVAVDSRTAMEDEVGTEDWLLVVPDPLAETEVENVVPVVTEVAGVVSVALTHIFFHGSPSHVGKLKCLAVKLWWCPVLDIISCTISMFANYVIPNYPGKRCLRSYSLFEKAPIYRFHSSLQGHR